MHRGGNSRQTPLPPCSRNCRRPPTLPILRHPAPSYSTSISSKLQETDATDSRPTGEVKILARKTNPHRGNTKRHIPLDCNIMDIICPQNIFSAAAPEEAQDVQGKRFLCFAVHDSSNGKYQIPSSFQRSNVPLKGTQTTV